VVDFHNTDLTWVLFFLDCYCPKLGLELLVQVLLNNYEAAQDCMVSLED